MRARRRILIADDDPAICRLIEKIFHQEPYETVSTNDAESALLAIEREGRFDLIICDFMLPGITGLEFIEHLRLNEQTRSLPVVMISAHNRSAIGESPDGGANVFLDKPFSVSQLRSAVTTLI